jgi:hypothetical protein
MFSVEIHRMSLWFQCFSHQDPQAIDDVFCELSVVIACFWLPVWFWNQCMKNCLPKMWDLLTYLWLSLIKVCGYFETGQRKNPRWHIVYSNFNSGGDRVFEYFLNFGIFFDVSCLSIFRAREFIIHITEHDCFFFFFFTFSKPFYNYFKVFSKFQFFPFNYRASRFI